jgi:DNA-binding CsgD family transcriptional regulator
MARGASPQQRQIAKLIAGGMKPADVAETLKIKPATVQTHLRSLRNITGATTSEAAARQVADEPNGE